MKCHEAIELLPSYAVGATTTNESVQLQQHLEAGCSGCQLELDELLSAASLLSENLDPVVPPPSIKAALIERIATEPQSTESQIISTSQVPAHQQVTKAAPAIKPSRLQAFFPYVAASLAAVALGSLAANFLTGSAGNDANPAAPRATQQVTQQWQQSIDAAERAFGPPRERLTSVSHSAAEQSLRAAIFYDSLAKQLHVLTSEIPAPPKDQKLWLWLLDEQGEVLSGTQLDHLGHQCTIAVLDLVGPPQELHEVAITYETLGDHKTPSDNKVSRSQLEPSL